MTNSVLVKTSNLSNVLQAAVHMHAGRKPTIAVQMATEFCPYDCGHTGARAFVVIVSLSTGESKKMLGSWGGPNPFSKASEVDDPKAPSRPIATDQAVIVGYEGGVRSASLLLHPDSTDRETIELAAKLAHTSGAPCSIHADCQGNHEMAGACTPAALSERARRILAVHRGIKAGAYRREELARMGAKAEEVQALITSGHLSQNKVGAVTITLKGKNACEGVKVY